MISIIIPVYNRDYCLSRCLESVLQQTFTDWECILIDDGSTDRTLAVCYSYVEKDPRFRVYSQSNGGVSVARNRGLEQAHGEYVVFIDSDDWVEPDFLWLLHESAEKDITPLCGMDVQFTDGCHIDCSVRDILYRTDSNIVDMFCGDLSRVFSGPVCKLYDRSVIETYRIRFPVGISWGEDMIFNCTYFQYVDCIKGVPFLLYHVVKQEKSLSVSAKYDSFLTDTNQKIWQNVSRFFLSKGLDERYMGDYYLHLLFQQITGVQYVRDRLSWIKRYKRMNYLIQSADRGILKQYRFKNIRFLLVYYRLSMLFFLCYEVYGYLNKHAKKSRNHQ